VRSRQRLVEHRLAVEEEAESGQQQGRSPAA
jgi:hypothetical protein